MERLGWVSNPNCGRGTANILESCLLTIVLATWTALHLNIHEKKLGRWQSLWRKLKWTAFAIYLPEYIAWLAIRQRSSAEAMTKEMHNQGHQDWTTAQSFYAEMGGIYVNAEPDGAHGQKATRLPLFDTWYLCLVKYEDLPTKNYIEDKSKADTFKRVVTTCQAAWAFVQVIARWQQHLALSNLELATVAYVLCALATYIAWWDKPYDVGESTVLELVKANPNQVDRGNNSPSNNDVSARQDNTVPVTDADFERRLQQLRASFIVWKSPDFAMIYHYTPSMTNMMRWFMFLAVVFCSFGGIHMAGWNFSFPTIAEMWLWRISSLLQLAAPFLLFLSLVLKRVHISRFGYPRDRWVQGTYGVMYPVCGGLYIVARTIIIVLLFSTLRSSPPDMYKKVDWLSYAPNWG